MAGARALVAAVACWWWLTTAAATELDLLGALSLHNTSRAGVSTAPGMQPQRTAYTLQGDSRALQVEGEAFDRAADLLRRSPEFTLLAALRQEPANSGTILSFSHGYNRYLEVQSSGRRDEVRLHYVAAGASTARVETFPFRLADGAWHRLALAVSGAQATLLVDCHPLYRRLIPPPDRNFTQPQLALWVGQRNSKHSLFKGTLQDVRLVSGPHGYLTQCPGLDSECPTCGQFALLQATVQELTTHIHDLSIKLVGAEARLARLEQCDCQKSCYSNGTIHADGASWQKDCNRCSCVHGEITCRPVECDRAECKNPVLHPGECCPSCLRHCLLHGNIYEHGERFAPKECAECLCHDGNMQCSRVDPERACPPLPCDPSDQFTVPGECCKFCPGVDYCSMGHSCDENATCMNLNTKYTCTCNQGFQGDGLTCQDVDECQEEGGLRGHHCHSNTRCVNVVGSYVCQCLQGYARKDKFNCVEVDECAVESHGCHAAALCTNTPGSYTCRCRDGFSGDGYNCAPICTGGCLNGGVCAAPESCACPQGFGGARCERDLDECAPLAHPAARAPCVPRALCVNTPGSYYCVCRDGYRRDPHLDHCEDVDECVEGFHTCHPSARCVNIEGGFKCECETQPCELSCSWQGKIMSDGSRWAEAGGCQTCACDAGVATCARTPCACDLTDNLTTTVHSTESSMVSPSAPAACCPHCEPRYHCRHQEMHHVTFRSGERWLYQCQICECLLGEVDCWEPECEESGVCCSLGGAAGGAAGGATGGAAGGAWEGACGAAHTITIRDTPSPAVSVITISDSDDDADAPRRARHPPLAHEQRGGSGECVPAMAVSTPSGGADDKHVKHEPHHQPCHHHHQHQQQQQQAQPQQPQPQPQQPAAGGQRAQVAASTAHVTQATPHAPQAAAHTTQATPQSQKKRILALAQQDAAKREPHHDHPAIYQHHPSGTSVRQPNDYQCNQYVPAQHNKRDSSGGCREYMGGAVVSSAGGVGVVGSVGSVGGVGVGVGVGVVGGVPHAPPQAHKHAPHAWHHHPHAHYKTGSGGVLSPGGGVSPGYLPPPLYVPTYHYHTGGVSGVGGVAGPPPAHHGSGARLPGYLQPYSPTYLVPPQHQQHLWYTD